MLFGNLYGEIVSSPTLLFTFAGINFDHIIQKTMAVLNPMKNTDHDTLSDNDMAGPLVFGMAFGTTLLFAGKLHFG